MEQQEELFKEFEREKGKFEKIADSITRRKRRPYVHLALESVVFLIIVIIMCIIVAFALGVERGKRFVAPLAPVIVKESEQRPPLRGDSSPVIASPDPSISLRVNSVGAKQSQIPLPYTLQLISYKQKEHAESVKERLSGKGIDAFIIPSGKWYQVCAGSYADTNEAVAALKEFQKEYKGCFVRKR